MKPTQEQVIAWAREAGVEAIYSACDEPNVRYAYEDWDNELERFAALAYEAGRRDENEACAKVCEAGTGEPIQMKTLEILRQERERIAAAIRARREQ